MMSLALALMLSAAAADPAPAPATGDATTTQTAKPEKPKRICKSIKMTGSALGRRICKTEEQWAASESANIDLVNQSYKQNIGNDPVAAMGRGN